MESNTLRKLYDLCTLHVGESAGLIIMKLDDDSFNHSITPWQREGFVIHLESYCWEVLKDRRFKAGEPDGFTYIFNNQSSDSMTADQAIDLLQHKLSEVNT